MVAFLVPHRVSVVVAFLVPQRVARVARTVLLPRLRVVLVLVVLWVVVLVLVVVLVRVPWVGWALVAVQGLGLETASLEKGTDTEEAVVHSVGNGAESSPASHLYML